MSELARSVRERPAPLPTPLRPMADQIAARRPVLLSTDGASRRALRSVGKRAATVGDTIHLDAAADQLATPTLAIREVVAHELTHVAHTSAAPRFFDDIDDSPEERRADAVARLIARAPVAVAASTLGAPHTFGDRPPAPAGGSAAAVVRRSPMRLATHRSAATTGPTEPGTVSAAEMVRSMNTPVPTPRPTGTPDVVRRVVTEATPDNEVGALNSSGTDGLAIYQRDVEFREMLERHLDVILRRVEDQIQIDIERRGGRAWRGF